MALWQSLNETERNQLIRAAMSGGAASNANANRAREMLANNDDFANTMAKRAGVRLPGGEEVAPEDAGAFARAEGMRRNMGGGRSSDEGQQQQQQGRSSSQSSSNGTASRSSSTGNSSNSTQSPRRRAAADNSPDEVRQAQSREQQQPSNREIADNMRAAQGSQGGSTPTTESPDSGSGILAAILGLLGLGGAGMAANSMRGRGASFDPASVGGGAAPDGNMLPAPAQRGMIEQERRLALPAPAERQAMPVPEPRPQLPAPEQRRALPAPQARLPSPQPTGEEAYLEDLMRAADDGMGAAAAQSAREAAASRMAPRVRIPGLRR